MGCVLGTKWRRVAGIASVLLAITAGWAWLALDKWCGTPRVRADSPEPPPPELPEPPPLEREVYFEQSSYTVTEGGTLTITVLLSSAADEPVSVDYQVLDGSGTVLQSGTITFGPGATVGSFDYTAPDDNCPSGDVYLTLLLSNPQGGNTALGEPSWAGLTVLDNDTEACECP
jgi:hypothetical protein